MARFCVECGTALKDGAVFCPGCGKRLTAETPKCVRCGAVLKPEEKYCSVCGARAVAAADDRSYPSAFAAASNRAKSVTRQGTHESSTEAIPPAEVPATVSAPEESPNGNESAVTPLPDGAGCITAAAEAGETALGGTIAAEALFGDGAVESPLKTLAAGLRSFARGVIALFTGKDNKLLIFAGVFALVWIVLLILASTGVNILPVRVLNWLTFAKGGTGRSIPGRIGGLLGKTAVATAVLALIAGGYRSLGKGAGSLFAKTNFTAANVGTLLIGAGCALIVYQAFAGRAMPGNTMPAMAGLLLAATALGERDGFLYRFAQSLTAKVTGKIRTAQDDRAGSLLSGAALGSAAAIPLSFIPFAWTPLILGGVCVLAGIVLAIVGGSKAKSHMEGVAA